MELKLDMEIGVDARDPTFGTFLWNTIRQDHPALFPRKFGDYEPLPYSLKGDSIEPLVEMGLQDCMSIIWKPKKTSVEGILGFTNGKRFSHMTIYGHPKHLSASELKSLQLTIAVRFHVVWGFIHLLSDEEFEATRPWHHQVYAPFNSGINPRELERYLPNLGWATFFGRPYVGIMGADVISNTPAHWVERCGEGYYVQLTEDILDTCNDYARFDALREQAKAHLGRQFFFDPTGQVDHYVAPEFKYPERWLPASTERTKGTRAF